MSHVIHTFKMQPSKKFEVKTRLLLGIEPNESSSWRAAWVSLSAVQHCAYSCSNRIQVCVDAHAMAALEVAGGTSSTAVLGSFDSSRRTPPWRFLWNFYNWQRGPALEGGEDRNTDADRSHVFRYVTLTPSESRRPSSLSEHTEWARRVYGPAGSRTV